jgi:hypothetical protein
MITLATVTNVGEAVQLLSRDPLIGRLVDTYRRELIISKGVPAMSHCIAGSMPLRRHWCSVSVINVKRDIREFRQGSPSG